MKPPGLVGELHRHKHGKSRAFVAVMVRVPHFPVDERQLAAAIAWLDERWAGGVFVPDEFLPLLGAA